MSAKRTVPVLGGIACVFMAVSEAMAQRRSSESAGDVLGFFSNPPLAFWVACVISFVALTVIVLLLVFLSRVQNRKADDLASPVIVVVIVFAVLIMTTIGLRNEQIAPAFALFGTIVGYLLGRFERTGGGK